MPFTFGEMIKTGFGGEEELELEFDASQPSTLMSSTVKFPLLKTYVVVGVAVSTLAFLSTKSAILTLSQICWSISSLSYNALCYTIEVF